MVTFDSVSNYPAVMYLAMKLFCTCKDVNHGAITVFDVGEGGMIRCVKKGIFDSELVGNVQVEQVGASCVAAGGTIGSKNIFLLIAVAWPNFLH